MMSALGSKAVYAALVGVASFIQVLVGRGFGAVQLNALIRIGSLGAALITLFAVHGTAPPAGL
jgi:Na+-driven multidrug efflux pump